MSPPSAPTGVLSTLKPLGWTSHDVVAVVRSIVGLRRVGHGGTLDPLATGVLPILIGEATTFSDRFREAAKAYGALVRFGTETATDDREGTVTREAALPDLAGVALDAALGAFRGEVSQVPPTYAAVKVAGRPAYARARSGEAVVLEARRVTIARLTVASWRPPELRLLVVCSSGTYVRALARDIGRSLGSAAHLAALVRLAVGALAAEGSVGIERLRQEGRDAALASLRPADERLLVLGERFRRDDAARLLANWGA